MNFVDGENLLIRYGKLLKQRGQTPLGQVTYSPDIFVWTTVLNLPDTMTPAVLRKYYYTAVQGDYPSVAEIEIQLKTVGIETPRAFKKDRGKDSKRADITLATDMLLHATRKHYDVAVLVAGAENHVPLVKAVQGEGARAIVWLLPDGLSPAPPGGDFDPARFDAEAEHFCTRYPKLPRELLKDLFHRHGLAVAAVRGDVQTLDDLGSDFGGGLYQREAEYFIGNGRAMAADNVPWRRSKTGFRATQK